MRNIRAEQRNNRNGNRDDESDAWPKLKIPYPTGGDMNVHLRKLQRKCITTSSSVWTKGDKEMSMPNIFPDDDGSAGSYPEPSELVLPTAEELADPARKDVAMVRFRSSYEAVERQKLYIITEKNIIMSAIKESLNDTTKDILRQTKLGRELLLSKNQPLELINLLRATDFSREGLFSVDALEKFHKAVSKSSVIKILDSITTSHYMIGTNVSMLKW